MKILIAEDDKMTRALLVGWVRRWGYEVVTAENGTEALELLLSDLSIHMAVLDWMMPGMTGPEVCSRLREQRQEPYVYTTLLTSRRETEDVVEGLKSGADDYIQKPCHPLELEVRLRVGRRLVELQTNLILTREKLRFEATHDSMTQLWNRGAMVEQLASRVAEARTTNLPLGVVMMDVDHFKLINDTYGHAIGDAVLQEVSERLSRAMRPGDSVGRYGGEEFVVILADCNLEYGLKLSEQLRRDLVDRPVRIGELSIPISASFGVASTSQSAQADSELLTRAADAAMYRSKNDGRDRVSPAEIKEFERPSMRPPVSHPDSAA